MSDNQFNCPTCGGNFQTKQELDSHSQEMHSKAEKPQEHAIACSKCGLKAKTATEMQGHSCSTC